MLRQLSIAIAVVLASGLAGCEAVKPSPGTKIETELAHEPPLKQNRQVNVGEVMYRAVVYQTGTAAQTTGDTFVKTVLFGDVKMPPGTLLENVPEKDYATYCTPDKVYVAMGSERASAIACFADEDEDGWFERVQVPGVKFGTWTETDGPAYQIRTVNRPGQEREELLYQGRGGDTIKIAYRAFDAQGRPGASQAVEYTLSPDGSPTTIGFRNARLVIESADNLKIRYQVVQGFGQQGTL